MGLLQAQYRGRIIAAADRPPLAEAGRMIGGSPPGPRTVVHSPGRTGSFKRTKRSSHHEPILIPTLIVINDVRLWLIMQDAIMLPRMMTVHSHEWRSATIHGCKPEVT